VSSPGASLFGRKVELVVSAPGSPPAVKAAFNDTPGLDVSGFDIDFSVRRSLAMKHPNVCKIEVYNLSESSRKALDGGPKTNLVVSLSAGYQGGLEQIYFSECRAAWTERVGPDWVTHLEAGDGDKAMKARCATGPGGYIPVASALTYIAQALGVGTGNLQAAQTAIAQSGIYNFSASAVSGSAARRLTDFCRSAGLEWSIQNGNLQIIKQGALTRTNAVLCSVDTGMIDSPTVDSHGLLSAKMLITPGLVPGGLVHVDSEFYSGDYRINRCHWDGSVRGLNWYVQFEGEKYAS